MTKRSVVPTLAGPIAEIRQFSGSRASNCERRAKSAQGDTPNRLSRDQPEKVTVTDPAHPLFRREFVLAAIRGSVVNGQAVVVYRGDVVLRVPIRATSLDPDTPPLPTSKLSLAAIRDLVRLAVPGERTDLGAIGQTSAAAQVGDAADAASLASQRAAGDAP